MARGAAATIFETILHGKKAVAAAGSKSATQEIGRAILESFPFLPDSAENDRAMILLPTVLNLKKSLKERSRSNPFAQMTYGTNPENDRTQLEFHNLDAHIVRWVKYKLSTEGHDADCESCSRWQKLRDDYAEGKSVNDGDAAEFDQITERLIVCVLGMAKVVVSTCYNLATPVFVQALGFVDLIVHYDAAYTPEADAYALVLIPHGCLSMYADPEHPKPRVMSGRQSEHAAILRQSLFTRMKAVGYPVSKLVDN